jgi:hypothetical protein
MVRKQIGQTRRARQHHEPMRIIGPASIPATGDLVMALPANSHRANACARATILLITEEDAGNISASLAPPEMRLRE